MYNDLKVAHCPMCGNVFQKNLRNMCGNCSKETDRQYHAVDRYLLQDRFADTEQLAEATSVPAEKIRSWIRNGKLNAMDYPNLTDQCDLCKAPIRKGHLCPSCTSRLNNDIRNTLENERLAKERQRAAISYKFNS